MRTKNIYVLIYMTYVSMVVLPFLPNMQIESIGFHIEKYQWSHKLMQRNPMATGFENPRLQVTGNIKNIIK